MISRRVIYSEPQEIFFKDILTNQVASKMKNNLESVIKGNVKDSEYRSWQNSPVAVKNLLELSGVKDTFVAFEFSVPYTGKRIDCMLYSRNNTAKGYVVHIELKQWDAVEATNIEGNFVETYTGYPNNLVPHPSQQVKGYHDYLTGFIEAFEKNELQLFGCAYCHNYEKVEGKGLHDPIYNEIIKEFPIYSGNEVVELANKLKEILSAGCGLEIFNKFMQSPIKPSKKILESASKIITNNSDFTLINEQLLARNTILSKVRNARKNNEKSVVIIKGGPGTGKTVIALHILAEIASAKHKRSVFFSAKSKPLLEGIKNRLGKGNKSKLLFTNLNQFIPAKANENSVDVLIIDEAHRIEKTPNNQYTKLKDRTDLPQIDTLIRAAKTSIFFIDDKQVIRSTEIGSTSLIKVTAEKYKCSIEEVELASQFRCNGSDSYLDWIESTLGYSTAQRILSSKDNYDFKIFSSPHELYSTILEIDRQNSTTARLTSGFCWEWSNKLDTKGNLIKDIKIGDFEMPWETHFDIKRPPIGYVNWYEWAYKPEGIKQIGCIYTAQGFEFDYIGVIVGNDLKYDPDKECLIGDISETKDPKLKRGSQNFDEYVRNIYRVLMTRGLKGCYVYFMNKETEKFFKSRIK